MNTHQARLFIIKIIAQKIVSFVEHPVLILTPAAWPCMPPLGAWVSSNAYMAYMIIPM